MREEKAGLSEEKPLLSEKAEDGRADAAVCFERGNRYYSEQNYAEAVQWFRKAAEQGHSGAQNNLGFCYNNGQGVVQDSAEAVQWYRKAAEQGHIGAQNNLGSCYREGKGVVQNYAEAVQWYRKAPDRGLPKRNIILVFVIKKDGALHKTMPKRYGGIAKPPSRV